MHQGYYWALYGDNDEIVFTYSSSRARSVIEMVLNKNFTDILLSDGYKAYASYVQQTEGLVHAQCWAHTRRKFVEAKDSEPVHVDTVLQTIQRLYANEKQIRKAELTGETKREYRLEHSLPVVNELFEWVELQLQGIGLYIYLTDVLKRIDQHPNKAIDQLTPRLRKARFADNPLRSDLYDAV